MIDEKRGSMYIDTANAFVLVVNRCTSFEKTRRKKEGCCLFLSSYFPWLISSSHAAIAVARLPSQKANRPSIRNAVLQHLRGARTVAVSAVKSACPKGRCSLQLVPNVARIARFHSSLVQNLRVDAPFSVSTALKQKKATEVLTAEVDLWPPNGIRYPRKAPRYYLGAFFVQTRSLQCMMLQYDHPRRTHRPHEK